jgi:putative ABC transport system permease protein
VTPWPAIARAALGGNVRGNRTRLVLAVLAIALGVALGFAVHLVNRVAIAELTSGLAELSGAADLEVRGSDGGFSETLYPMLARDRDVAVASPVVDVDARVPGHEQPLHIVGIDVLRAAAIAPALLGTGADALDTLQPDTIFLSPAAGAYYGVGGGDALSVQTDRGVVRLRVAGLLPARASLSYASMDIAAVQDRFARAGLLSRIDLRLRPGVDAEAVRSRLASTLPAGVIIAGPEAGIRATSRMSRAYRMNLNVLALVALFTGGLLVFSTQALSVVRRRAQFALVRALGLLRRRLLVLVVAEGAAMGLAGGVIGVAVGYLLADLALRLFGADLGAGYFRGVAPRIAFDGVAALAFVLFGVLAAAAGGVPPALEAARARPAAALKAGDVERALVRLRTPWPGFLCLILAAALVAMPAVDGLPIAGYAAIGLLLLGALALLPRLVQVLLNALPRPPFAPAALALAQLRGAPGQASISLAAIVASVALMVSMVIMVASFRGSLEQWLDQVLPADIYVRAGHGGETAAFDTATQRAIASAPGVRRVLLLRVQRLLLDAGHAPVTLLARDADPADPLWNLPLVGKAIAVSGDERPIYASEAMTDLYGYRIGKQVMLPLGGREVKFTVAGLWRDYARQTGAVVMDRRDYIGLTGDTRANEAALWLAPGVQPAVLRREVERRAGGPERVRVAVPGEIRSRSLATFDRTFAVTYALEAAAVIIGLVALSAAFGALTLARRAEFGMLRHVGMTRAQVGAMLANEGFLMSAVGLGTGLPLGFLISLILIYVVNRQSFHWSMSLHVPVLPLVLLALVLLALASLTALASARRATGAAAIAAVREDW